MEAPVLGGVQDEDGARSLGFRPVRCSSLPQHHGHDGILVLCASRPVRSEGRLQRQVANHIAVHHEEVAHQQAARVEVAHGVADGVGGGLDELQLGEGRGARGPFRALDVVFDEVSVGAAVDEDLLDAGVGEELEGVFDERGVGEGQETLAAVSTARAARGCIDSRVGARG